MTARTSAVLAAAAAVALLASPARAAAPDAARPAEIRKLLNLTGAGQLGVQMARQMMAQLRPLIPSAPQSFWDEFASKLNPDDLVEKVIPIYARHLSAKDVKELIAFYESPVGRKLVAVQPQILQESMAAGQEWGREMAEGLVRTAREKGFEVKNL